MILSIYEAGLSSTFYYGFFGVGFAVTYAFLLWYGSKIALKKRTGLLGVSIGSILVLCVLGILHHLLKPVQDVLPIMNSYLNNMGRGFLFVPLIAWLVSWIFKVSWKKISNLYAFTQTIIWGFASLGCLFPGCCRGYPWKWGIYNVRTETRLFPTQIVNSCLLLSIAVLIYRRCKRMDFQPDGREYPIMLILVGIVRFSTEFLMDNPKIIWGLSSLSLDSIRMCIVGTVMLMVINRLEKRVKDRKECDFPTSSV